MQGLCRSCGKNLLSPMSMCDCSSKYIHYTLFDETIVISTLIKAIKIHTEHMFIVQIGDLIVEELKKYHNIGQLFFYHDEIDTPYHHFLNALNKYIQLLCTDDEKLIFCLKIRGTDENKHTISFT